MDKINAIQIKNLSYKYSTNLVLNDITISIPAGEIISIMGLNGSGKSTLINCIMGFLKIPPKKIFVMGHDICELSVIERAKLMSYVPQDFGSNCFLDVFEYLSLGRIAYKKIYEKITMDDENQILKIAEQMKIDKLLGCNMSEISGGERQLVSIARALVQDTPIIIFDEPTASLDLRNQVIYLKMLKELKNRGKTIVFSTHNPNHVLALNSYNLILSDNKLMSVGYSEEKITSEILRNVYGLGVDVISNDGKKHSVLNI